MRPSFINDEGQYQFIDGAGSRYAPTYVEHGVVHYGVANMPGAVPRTSTTALTNVTLGYALALANKGAAGAARGDRAVALGLNTFGGHVTYGPVAVAHNLEYVPIERALA